MFENDPDNNTGASAALQIGLNNNRNRGRGLYRFDLSAIPRGSIVNSVSMEIQVVGAGGGSTDTAHELRRVQLPWSEGGSVNALAIAGESSWCSRSHGAEMWTVPGGNAGTDFAALPSAAVTLGGAGSYAFESTGALVADVQAWVDGTVANDGWVLISDDESTRGNSRRIGTRESLDSPPILTVEYTPFTITEFIRRHDGRLDFWWSGGTPPFEVDTSSDGGASWQPVLGVQSFERHFEIAAPEGDVLFRVRERAEPDTSARYRVDWNATWSAETHPDEFPGGAHFSDPIGATHDGTVAFWAPGGTATAGIERMAELGATSTLTAEVNAAIGAGSAASVLLGDFINSPGGTSFEFDITAAHPLVTLVTMIAPSPDWFVGVHGLDLQPGGSWVDSLTVALDPYDAGTDSGASYTSPNADSDEPISRITGAPFLDGDKVRPIGVFTFTRVDGG